MPALLNYCGKAGVLVGGFEKGFQKAVLSREGLEEMGLMTHDQLIGKIIILIEQDIEPLANGRHIIETELEFVIGFCLFFHF